MRIAWTSDRPWDLGAVAAVVAAAVLAVLADAPAWLRVPVGLAFVLACPGYAFVAALYPERHRDTSAEGDAAGDAKAEGSASSAKADAARASRAKRARPDAAAEAPVARRGLAPLERVALSLGLSIAIVPLLGLALNYTPWGIRERPIVAVLALFTLACAAAAWTRRRRLPADERFTLAFAYEAPAWSARAPLDRALTVALALAVVFAAGSLVYVLAAPRQGEAFTEFYQLGPTGKAACYPSRFEGSAFRVSDADAQAGCPLQVSSLTLGVVNHEGRDVTYHLRALWTRETREGNASRVEEVATVKAWQVTLPHVPVDLSLNATFRPQHEEEFAIPPPPFAGTVRLSFQLFLEAPAEAVPRAGLLEEPHRRLHLWIDQAPAVQPQ